MRRSKRICFASCQWGGLWHRETIGGKVLLGCKRFLEISLTNCPSNIYARASGVRAVIGVKSVGGVWLPDTFSTRWNAAVQEHKVRQLGRDVDLAGLQLEVAAMLA